MVRGLLAEAARQARAELTVARTLGVDHRPAQSATDRPRTGRAIIRFALKLAKGSFQSQLAAVGLTDTTVTDAPVEIGVEIAVNGTMYAIAQAQTYTAKTGKTAKTK